MSLCIGLSLCLHMLTVNAETMDINCKWRHFCSKSIRCEDNEDCIVNCETCAESTVYCPTTPNQCTVICSTQGSCEGTRIDATSSDSNLRKLTVIINKEPSTFTNGLVKCPSYGECNIHCENDYVCQNITVDGRSASHTNISLIANGTKAFYNSSIYASSYGTLDIFCNGYEACKGTNPIQTDPNTLALNIKGKGSLVLAQSNVYCPRNTTNVICNIDIQGTHAMQDTAIHATDAFNDIRLICDATFESGCTGITMWCDTYNSSCSISMAISTNTWHCVDSTPLCNTNVKRADVTTHTPYYTIETVPLRIEFDYVFISENDHNLSIDALHVIFTNISHGFIATDIKRIDDACVARVDYDIEIDQNERSVVVEVTILACNENTWLVFRNLADIIVDEPIYIGRDDDSTDLHSGHDTQDTLDSFELTSIIFGSVFAVCIVIIVLLCCVNGRKDVRRYRIDTASKSSGRPWVTEPKYAHANRDGKKDEFVEDDVESVPPSAVPGSSVLKAMQVMSDTEDVGRYRLDAVDGIKMSIDIGAVENPQYEMVNTVTPYAAEEEPGSPVSKEVDDIEIAMKGDGDNEVKQWLTYHVGLPEYHQHFTQRGYESLNSVKAIDNRQQLEDIGVFVERDIMQMLKEIKKLQESKHGKTYSEGLPRNFDADDRYRQTSEGRANVTME